MTERGARRTATYLPHVATEQGWDQIETIDSLLRKGGYRGQITQETRRGIKLTRYQSTECKMTWNEWRDFRQGRAVGESATSGAGSFVKVQC